MPFKRFVEVGRVCLVTFGPMEGKLCVIVNMIDQSHVLVDGTPAGDAGTPRMGMALQRVMLTDLKVPIKLNATAKCVPAHCQPASGTAPCCLDLLCRGWTISGAQRAQSASLCPRLEAGAAMITTRRVRLRLKLCRAFCGVTFVAAFGQRHLSTEMRAPLPLWSH
jgi:hypothetical protein